MADLAAVPQPSRQATQTITTGDTEMAQPNQPAASESNCDFPGRPGPAGHVNACQLCPGSPTYWRGKTGEQPPAGAKPCRWTSTAVEVTQ